MQLVLRVIAILGIIVAALWFKQEPSYSTLSGILAAFAAFFSFYLPKEEKSAETLDQRNRRVMLDHVENFWVKGVLEKSLHGAALLELGIKENPSAVNYPWTIKKESTDEILPAGKSMLEIFQEIGMERSLLILGAPGSGKTTMLLELARQLIERARENETEPIPVVFNLASWKDNQTLVDWLAEQQNIVYSVPKKIAPMWVKENRMLLLLDGLDEVKADSRAKCVEAINQFRKEYGLTSLVVCSRIEEYSMLDTKLSLQGAITLQRLTSEQINAYFDRSGKSLSSVKQILKKDKALQELAETPLMLSIMALAYKDKNADELIASGNLEEQRSHLFEAYINRMFERSARSEHLPFAQKQTLHYLSWLARRMIQHNIITYQIESMQPSWIVEQAQRRLYRLLFVPLGGPLLGLSVGLSVGVIFGLRGGLLSGLFFGLLGGRIDGLRGTIEMVDQLKWSWKGVQRRLLGSLLLGLGFGLFVALLGWLLTGLFGGLFGGLLGGLLIGLLIGFNSVEWLSGLLIGLSIGLFVGLRGGLSGGLLGWLRGGLLSGLLLGLFFVLISGMRVEQIEETTYPGQRLKQTLFSIFSSTLIFGLTFGLMFGLFVSLLSGLSGGLLGGLYGGLQGGYGSLIQHYSLRLVLARYHLLPLKLIPFLDYAVSLIFLRRVGGGYIFVHRLLMEHFAAMEV